MSVTVNDQALNILFRDARSHDDWTDAPVGEDILRAVWDLAKMGPTTANSGPARIVFVATPEAKARLKPALSKENLEKTMHTPVTAVIAHDLCFHDRLGELFPQADARAWFAGNDPLIEVTAFRNGSLQGAYFMLAARALGLACGPMSGFDNAKVDAEFFPQGTVKSNFLCALGYGRPETLPPRNPRLAFDDACTML